MEKPLLGFRSSVGIFAQIPLGNKYVRCLGICSPCHSPMFLFSMTSVCLLGHPGLDHPNTSASHSYKVLLHIYSFCLLYSGHSVFLDALDRDTDE